MMKNQVGASSIAMLLIGMVAGALLMVLFNGAPNNVPGNLGSGLKNMVSSQGENSTDSSTGSGSSSAAPAGEQVEFDFYEVLPDVGRVIMDDFPDVAPARTGVEKKVIYMIQAASLRNQADADSLRASLALEGYESVIQRVNVEGKGTYYRVRIGPYQSRRTVKNEINKLQAIGISAMAVSLDAG